MYVHTIIVKIHIRIFPAKECGPITPGFVTRSVRNEKEEALEMPRRMDADDRLQQVLKVAYLFYEKEMTKTDISHEIRASTTQVIRLLEEAREQGFVRIEFSPPKLYHLGEELKRRYGWLQDTVVISYADDLVRHEARTEHDARASAAGRRAASLSS
jgi:DNA-binding transcriptional regulator LsrR (DeoR family)